MCKQAPRMERKNTVLLTVIAVATLLVAVVGATFAYFTASSNPSGSTENSAVTTPTQLDKVTLTKAKTTSSTTTDLTIYPGRMIYVGASVKAAVDGTTNAYTVTYDFKAKVTLSDEFSSDVKYYLYRTTTSVDAPVTCASKPTGTPAEDGNGVKYSISCSKDGTFEKGDSVAGNLIATDTITAGEGTGVGTAIDVTDQTIDTGVTYYYYLVVEYPDNSKDQSADATKTITAEILDAEVKSTAVKS